MKDINGIEIKVGDTVKSTQPSGGVFNPAPAQIGTVVFVEYCNEKSLAIRYSRKYAGKDIDVHILLAGKINEIVS